MGSGTSVRIAGERSGSITEASLAVIAAGAVLTFLWLARELLVPVTLGVFLAFAVSPLVLRLEKVGIPRALAALVGTLLASSVVAGVVAILYGGVAAFAQELPAYEERILGTLRTIASHLTHLQRQGETFVATAPGSVKVDQGLPWAPVLVGTAQGAIALVAQATVAVFTLYFALVEGPRYREKLLAALPRDAAARRHAVVLLREIQRDIEQYVVNRLVLNAVLGVVLGAIYAAYGLKHASLWALGTALAHFIPYVGPALGLVPPALMAFLQFGTIKDVAAVAGIYVVLVSLQGNVADPIFLGKQLRLSAVAVFLGSLFWFWIWGPVGLFLAVPLLAAIRATSRHFPRARVVADVLGE